MTKKNKTLQNRLGQTKASLSLATSENAKLHESLGNERQLKILVTDKLRDILGLFQDYETLDLKVVQNDLIELLNLVGPDELGGRG